MNLPIKGTCHCRKGIERDNCPDCEGTGKAIDWREFHRLKQTASRTHEGGGSGSFHELLGLEFPKGNPSEKQGN